MSPYQQRELVTERVDAADTNSLSIQVQSFGFKKVRPLMPISSWICACWPTHIGSPSYGPLQDKHQRNRVSREPRSNTRGCKRPYRDADSLGAHVQGESASLPKHCHRLHRRQTSLGVYDRACRKGARRAVLKRDRYCTRYAAIIDRFSGGICS